MGKNIIRVERPLSAHEIELGKGVLLNVANATPPIINFLREKYQEDNTCITGDIEALFNHTGSGLKPGYRYYQ